jgi:predicted adenylyl cyclase CyaB
MKEVEVKIVDIDRARVEAKLRSLGASRTFDGTEESVFFDFPGNPLGGAKNLLRLRKEGERTQLTFKKYVDDEAAKVRDEYQVAVSEFETMQRILGLLGLIPYQQMVKHRTSYVLNSGVRVDLDKYSGALSHIPDLMEIEAEDIATVESHIKLLGFQPEDAKSWTTFELIDHYSGKKAKA